MGLSVCLLIHDGGSTTSTAVLLVMRALEEEVGKILSHTKALITELLYFMHEGV